MNSLSLDDEQNSILLDPNNLFVQACPGSGKTRLLTARIIKDLAASGESRRLLGAMTFTIKAAEEIQRRIEEHQGQEPRLWVGTIHSFCRHWVLGPHRRYCPEVRFGMNIADEIRCRRILDGLGAEYRLKPFTEIPTRLGLDGLPEPSNGINRAVHRQIVKAYHEQLLQQRLIDHDLTLYYSHRLLAAYPQISLSLSRLFQHLYVDEVQDMSELQHTVLAHFLKHCSTSCFFVGDPDQAIYSSLGGTVKSAEQIRAQCKLTNFLERSLTNNYRSTQRLAGFFSLFGNNKTINCKGKHSHETGRIAFIDREPPRAQLPMTLANLVQRYLGEGVPSQEICLLAPRWDQVFGMVRELIPLLPGVAINAPGICPFKEEDGMWHQFAQLFFGRPTASNIRWRSGIARKLLSSLSEELSLPTNYWDPRSCMRCVNNIRSNRAEVPGFLADVLEQFLTALNFGEIPPPVKTSISNYITLVQSRISRWAVGPLKPTFLYDTFSHSGITVSTCHGVKGLEFDAVLCYRLHEGWLPHWDHVINARDRGKEEARKLLYVIASRAKRYLHLFAETGHTTKRGDAYITTPQLRGAKFAFDNH